MKPADRQKFLLGWLAQNSHADVWNSALIDAYHKAFPAMRSPRVERTLGRDLSALLKRGLVRRVFVTTESPGDSRMVRLACYELPKMTFKEKHEHPWACWVNRGDTQCPARLINGGGHLCCCWKIGHPEELGHQTTYDGDDRGLPWEIPDAS